ncbi:right-handed parallel beta-helix repeat-containing protein, partial [Candidatus Eisenbacteria bacterium]
MRAFIIAGLILARAFVVPSASSTTYLVLPDGTGDYATIQAAIDASAEGDTIALADGTFTGDGNHSIDFLGKAITVRSESGNADACVIDCESQRRAFDFHSAEDTTSVLDGIGITNGNAWPAGDFGWGGAVRCYQGSSPTIANCLFWNNHANHGGAIGCLYASSAHVRDCFFYENWASQGGAMGIYESSPTVERCEFRSDSAQWGGAVVVSFNNGTSVAEFKECVFDSSVGNGGPGGMYLYYSSPRLVNCTLVRSISEGIRTVGADPILQNTIIAHGVGGPGMADVGGSYPTLTCCDIYGNEGGDWIDFIADQSGIDGNISADPLFCDIENNDYQLQANSPCASFTDPNPECDLIGALGVGCEPPPDPGYLWVPNYEDDTVSRVDAGEHEVAATIPVGDGPSGIAVGRTYVYVTHRNSSFLYRIGKTTDAVTDSVDLSSVMAFGIGVAVDTTGYAFVVGRCSMGSSGVDCARLAKIDSSGVLIDWAVLPDIQGMGGVGAMWQIGVGLNRIGSGFIPWSRSWNVATGITVFDTESLSTVT